MTHPRKHMAAALLRWLSFLLYFRARDRWTRFLRMSIRSDRALELLERLPPLSLLAMLPLPDDDMELVVVDDFFRRDRASSRPFFRGIVVECPFIVVCVL